MRSPSLVPLLVAAVLTLFPAGSRAADCPSAASFVPAASGSTADTGWSGLALARPIAGNTLHLGLSCPAASPPCGTCTVTGAGPDLLGTFQRCSNDTSIKCSVATGAADCGAPGMCRLFLTVPQSAAAGGVASCYTNEITAPVTGTVDENGAMSVTVTYTGRIYQALTATVGCPTCDGDGVPNNGVQSGHCSGGARDGLPCDANGVSLPPYEDFGSSSFDCPPVSEGLIATLSPGPVTFSTATQTRTLSAASPDCTASLGSGKCFCDTCNDAAGEPCASNADCPPSGGNPGVCGGKRCEAGTNVGAPCVNTSECPGSTCKRLGEPTKPNACVDGVCTDTGPVGDGLGECENGPVDNSCANHANRGCSNDADCGGGVGACQAQNRLCYVTDGSIGDAISATGVATPPVGGISDPTTLAMITCQGSSRVNAVDAVLGLPGLARNHHVGTLTFGADGDADCPLTPDSCRAPTVPGKSSVQLKDQSPDSKDQLKWSWKKGAATTLAELGDPTTTTEYVLCVYDPNGLRMTSRVPAGGLCDGRPCWKATANGFTFKRKDGFPRGITRLVLRAGTAGKSQMQATGKGDVLPMPLLGTIAAPLQVQLRNRASGLCWGATYPAPFQKATATEVKARD